MQNLAQKTVKAALAKGAAEAEAYVYEGQATSVGIERGQITKSNRIIDRVLGIRVSVNKAIGFAYTNIVDSQSAVEKAVANALAAARASKPDPAWKGLPEKKPYAIAEKTFDRRIIELRPEDLVNTAAAMLDAAAHADKRVFPVEGGAGAGYVANAIANSNGVAGFDKSTVVECSLAAVAKEGNKVQRGQSAFKDRIGTQVASEKVTIYDDGLFPAGLRTAAFDGEGTPQQKTLLVEKGILRNFLYDNYAAKKEGRESTGNASRAGYLSTPSIETTNFHILPGGTAAEELLGEVDDGLLIYYLQGAHSSNPVSGEFSVVATPAWKIKKGEIVHPPLGVMLGGKN